VVPRSSCFRIKSMGRQIMVQPPTSSFMLNAFAIPQFAPNCTTKLTICTNSLHAYILTHMCYSFFIPSDTFFSLVALGHASSVANDVAHTFHSRWHPCKAIRTFNSLCALISEAALGLFCRQRSAASMNGNEVTERRLESSGVSSDLKHFLGRYRHNFPASPWHD
jgi:hypothetical protein